MEIRWNKRILKEDVENIRSVLDMIQNGQLTDDQAESLKHMFDNGAELLRVRWLGTQGDMMRFGIEPGEALGGFIAKLQR